MFLCLFTSQAALLVLSPILPEMAHEFGVSTATAGQLRAVSGTAGGVTALALAMAPRRPALRELLTAGAALVAGASALSAAAPTLPVMAGAQALLGAGVGTLVAAGIAAAGEWAEADERPKVLAWAIAGMPVAWIAGMPVVGAVSGVSWRLTWLAVPGVAALMALAMVRARPAERAARRRVGPRASASVSAWRRPDVARFALAELLANAAWASVLTYAGALLIESYGLSADVVALGLGAMAVAMLPGTFTARRHADRATRGLLVAITTFQGGAVLVLGAVRPAVGLTLAVLAVMAFMNGWRTMVASTVGMEAVPDDRLTTMSLRAAANQFGYLVGAAVGGAALAVGGFGALGVVLAALFAAAVAIHLPEVVTPGVAVPRAVRS